MSGKDLDYMRRQIDAIDQKLVMLFERRMTIVDEIAAIKQAQGMSIYHPGREQEVIDRAVGRLGDQSLAPFVKQLFKSMIQLSRRRQGDGSIPQKERLAPDVSPGTVIGYQGVQGSFSEEATLGYYRNGADTRHFDSFEDVFVALKEGVISYGVLPIENSNTGSIATVVDLMGEYGCYIIGEQIVKVRYHLWGLPGAPFSGITHVYSHPQGFLQCHDFLDEHRDWMQVPYKNTATSAKYVSEQGDPAYASLSSPRAGELYGLTPLAEHVHDNDFNYTRFAVIGPGMIENAACDKISILFTLDHVPGSLFSALSAFPKYGANILKIESRPIKGVSWEYFFYLDFSGNMAGQKTVELLDEVKSHCNYFKLLGNYQACPMPAGKDV
jgi:chorismate mutase/prephenate dehydratase